MTPDEHLKPGWLKRVMEEAAKDIAKWPHWKHVAGNSYSEKCRKCRKDHRSAGQGVRDE